MEKAAPKVKEASVANDNPEREARLAEALRANLRRRKTQSRAQTAAESADQASADPKAEPSAS